MKLTVSFVLLTLAFCGANAGKLKCLLCDDPKYNVKQILDLLALSKPIFADIKAWSQKRIDNSEMYSRLSVDEQKAELEKDLADLKTAYESNGHIPFPSDKYRAEGIAQIEKNALIPDEAERVKDNIGYFAARGASLYKEVSNIRRPIMAALAGVSYEEWSSYLDDEKKPIPFPLSCTLPSVRESKAFRTQAAKDLVAYGNAAKDLIDRCDDPSLNTPQILDLLHKSRAIFAEIKALSEKRIDGVADYSSLSVDDQKVELEKDLAEINKAFEDNGHPFPIDTFRAAGLSQINSSPGINSNIDYFAKRGEALYKQVSASRRPIMAALAGVSYEEWSSYLDDETKPIPFPLSCTLPSVRESKAFRTQAAKDIIAYGNSNKV